MPDRFDVPAEFRELWSEAGSTEDIRVPGAADAPARQPIDLFAGTPRFEIVRWMGEGGMGAVYEALDRERGTHVAIKTLRRFDVDLLRRLKNEFRGLQGIVHPNLVTLGELLEHEGRWFFTMELIRGVDFLSHVGGDEKRLRAALRQLAAGLVALHRAHKIHRDIKPHNVLVDERGRVVILDFGLVVDEQPGVAMPLAGTVAYMAPEQVLRKPVSPAADWYAVGVVLYKALTGRLPFEGPRIDVLWKKVNHEPRPPTALAENVPPDLEALCLELLRRDPAERPDEAAIAARLGMTHEAQPVDARDYFIGREDELGTLGAAFDEVVAGGAVTVIVRGASGVGKSALVRRFVDGLGRGDSKPIVLAGRCYEREAVPYKAFDEVMDVLGQTLLGLPPEIAAAVDPAQIALLGQVFPTLHSWALAASGGVVPAAAVDPRERRARVFAALRALLGRLAASQPLVVTIDDLQWADRDSLALLRALLQSPDAPRLLLVASMRMIGPEALQDARVIPLEPLPAGDARRLAAELLRRTFGAADPAREVVIADEAAGHPLFIAALVRHVGAPGGALRLDDVLWSQVEGLPAEARRLVEALAVAAGPLPRSVVAGATALPADALAQLADELASAHLVRALGTRPADAIDTYHDRVRETVLARLGGEARVGWHRRLAEALEATTGADAEALATHWHGAGEPARARAFLVRAAEEARDVLAFDRAARLYAAAGGLDAELGHALANAGRGPEAARAYLAASAGAGAEDAIRLRRLAGEQLLVSGHVAEGLAVYDDVLGELGMTRPTTPRRALVALLVRRAELRLRGLDFRPRDERDVPVRDLLRVDASWAVAAGLARVDVLQGAHAHTLNLILALRTGEPRRVMRALALEASLGATPGPRAAARTGRLLARMDAMAQGLGDRQARGLATGARGVVAWFEGRFADSVACCDEALAMLRGHGMWVAWEIDTVQQFALLALNRIGRLGEVRARAEAVAAAARERGDRYAEAVMMSSFLPAVCLADDRPAASHEIVAACARLWTTRGYDAHHFNMLVGAASADLYRGDGAAALRRIEEQWPSLEGSLLFRIHQLRIEAHALRARALLAVGRARDAERDARRLERAGGPIAAAHALAIAGAAAVVRGRTDDGRALVARAARGFAEQDMHLDADALRLRLGGAAADESRAAMRALTVTAPDRWAAARLPGLD